MDALAGFTEVISAAATEAAAARASVEHAAAMLGADVAAIVRSGRLVAAVGPASMADLGAIPPGAGRSWLDVPGMGTCPAVAVALEHPDGATLVVARQRALTPEDVGRLRALAGLAAPRMRMLCVLDDEREELERLTEERVALRRVATLVAESASADRVFSAVAEEVARVARADFATVLRFERDSRATVVGGWGDSYGHLPVGRNMALVGEGVAVSVLRTGRPAESVRFSGPPGSVADAVRRAGARSGGGVPIVVDGRLWGVVIAAGKRPDPVSPEAAARLAAFTGLLSTTIAHAQAREEVLAVADEQAALRRVATRVAGSAPPDAIFAAVAAEVGHILPAADFTLVVRYDRAYAETVGSWSREGPAPAVGGRARIGGHNVITLVSEHGRPTRVDRLAHDGQPLTALGRETGLRTSAGAPIDVAGRLWGAMIVASWREHGLPPGIEHRLAGFTELVATAIANTQARADLAAIADEQAALRRVATLIALGRRPEAVFQAVAEEVGPLFAAEAARVVRHDSDASRTTVGAWSRAGPASLSAVGAPITVNGRLWGWLEVARSPRAALPAHTETRLEAFADLAATAIANAQTRQDLVAIADEQAAVRRVAMLVAEAAPPSQIFAGLAAELVRLFSVDHAFVGRYEDGDAVTILAEWPSGDISPASMRSAVDAPITVDGRVWGVVGVASRGDEPLPPGTKARLGDFSALVATAIANANAQAELTASRARIVAGADETRRRIERDLHDGAQQRLVSLALMARAAHLAVPPHLGGLADRLDRVVAGLSRAVDELREFARGVHPAILAEGGLGPALRTLARRSAVPVSLDVRAPDRLPEPVEIAAYYCVAEALANTAAHARATTVAVAVEAAGDIVRVDVRDDGVGGADFAHGSGLIGLRDRVEALGGRIALRSDPGHGTSLAVELPVSAAHTR